MRVQITKDGRTWGLNAEWIKDFKTLEEFKAAVKGKEDIQKAEGSEYPTLLNGDDELIKQAYTKVHGEQPVKPAKPEGEKGK